MARWENSYGRYVLDNARILTSEEIQERYPSEANTFMARLTRAFVEQGYDIFYGENPNRSLYEFEYGYDWSTDIIVTCAYLYHTTTDQIIFGYYTDMSKPNAIYAAVKLRNRSDVPVLFS